MLPFMEAGLLFFQARRTAACRLALGPAAELCGFSLSVARLCTKEENLNAEISALLKMNAAVFLISAAPERRPLCAEAIFRTLRVPLREDGEPDGILRLSGREKSGYLLESETQAILLLPDDPGELKAMLPEAFARLAKKFGQADTAERNIEKS